MSKTRFPSTSFSVLSDQADQFSSGATYDFYKPSSFVEVYDFEPSLTRQEFAEECDINTIMARYEATGIAPTNVRADPFYGDFTAVPDLAGAMKVLGDANDAFMRLSAKVRREFDNDPVQFVEFASDPANLDQMRAWDLAPPAPVEPPEAAPQKVIIVPGDVADSALGGAPKPA